MPSSHIVIIGAGPAGCACAVALARRGFGVTLIESRPFPRAKVCGEFISPAATQALESILPRRRLCELGARRVGTMTIEVGDRVARWRLPREAWALGRETLDGALLDVARVAGARVLQPVGVRRVRYDDAGATVETSDAGELRCEVVIHADGVGRHDPAGPTPVRRDALAHKCHLRLPAGPDEGSLRMRAAAGAYIGLLRVQDGASTCALVARRAHVAAFGGDADAMLRALWPGFDPAWREGDWLSCGVAVSGCIAPGHVRSFRIGNAAAAVEPVGGEGIGLALWSGATLGAMLDPSAPGAAQRVLARLYRARLRVRRPACAAAARALMRPGLVRGAWPALRVPSLSLAPWWRLTGKPSRT